MHRFQRPERSTGRPARRRLVAAAGVLTLLATATGCLRHDEFVVRESPTSPVTFQLLADGGRHVVVSSTGPTATVPAQGWWWVDRATGDVEALPRRALRISADGARVLLEDGSLWRAGQSTLTAPGLYSDDLSYQLAVEGGTLIRRDVATGAVTDVEAGHPRPAGTTAVNPREISDDGRTVRYQLVQGWSAGVDRFARVGEATRLDLPAAGSETPRYDLSADGRSIGRIRLSQMAFQEEWGEQYCTSGAVVDVLDAATGAVVASVTRTYLDPELEYAPLEAMVVGAPKISDRGRRLWFTEVRWVTDEGICGMATPTSPASCAVGSRLVALTPDGSTSWALREQPDTIDLTANGVFALVPFVLQRNQPEQVVAAAGLFHVTAGEVEVLSQGPPATSNEPYTCWITGQPAAPCTYPIVGVGSQLSDDGRVVGARSMAGRGWYDYEDLAD